MVVLADAQLQSQPAPVLRGLALRQLDADRGARAAVITGNGRAFSAGGDYAYLDELTKDAELRRQTIVDGRAIRSLGTPHTAVIDGDACCYSIACASIIAKVTMVSLACCG